MREYLNMDDMKSTIREIYAEQIASVEDDPYFVFTVWSDEDTVEEYVDIMANELNDDMRRYLHMSDTKIEGNFRNIKWDYEGDYADMVRRLDEGADDEQTKSDRDYLTSWFWDAFGTWGLGYNFMSMLSESLYCAEMEESVAV